eukprot:scaffold46133_cov58-Phaeocystis_antarctica.AAC.1
MSTHPIHDGACTTLDITRVTPTGHATRGKPSAGKYLVSQVPPISHNHTQGHVGHRPCPR